MRFVNCVFLTVFIFYVASASSFTTANDLDKAETQFNQKNRNNNVYFLNVDKMFSDKKLRVLAEAAARGNTDEIDGIISSGVNVNQKGTADATVLFWALNNKKGFAHLLSKGADPNVVFSSGGSVIHRSAELSDSWFLETLLKNGGNPNLVSPDTGETPIFDAIYVNNYEAVKILSDFKANLNFINRTGPAGFKGSTPIFSAFYSTNWEMVYQLLQLGSDYNIKHEVINETILEVMVNEASNLAKPNLWLNKSIEWIKIDMGRVN
ncbi:ankyrin repeat domain-containing protein [Photobacterium sp.]|uniref:ankyrin repeat domain-containing protein n=1 Tax=Photobacterium sp. TaxID=660 RepID=UPI00299E32A1|nr:ankyrin repeat domain-containing protein [Photobacterium sp.]MDX1303033.1 ankyrin repeat domain-containing protein [Photobacterium sp.]